MFFHTANKACESKPSAVFTTKLQLSAAAAGLTYLTGVIGPYYFQKILKQLRHSVVLS